MASASATNVRLVPPAGCHCPEQFAVEADDLPRRDRAVGLGERACLLAALALVFELAQPVAEVMEVVTPESVRTN
jgi:hypothetical protein